MEVDIGAAGMYPQVSHMDDGSTVMKGTGQLWSDEGWADRLNRGPAHPMDNGFGCGAEQVN